MQDLFMVFLFFILNYIKDTLKFFGDQIGSNKALIYNFAILISVIYIPFAVHILENISGNFKEIDKKLFDKKYFRLRYIIGLYILLFFSLLFLNINSYLSFIVFVFSIFIISFLIKRLFVLYNFNLTFDERNKERLFLLENNLNLEFENKSIWLDTLKSDFGNNVNFFKSFINILFDKILYKIKNNPIKNEIQVIDEILFEYSNINLNIKKSSFLDPTDGNFIKLLEIFKYNNNLSIDCSYIEYSNRIRHHIKVIIKDQLKQASEEINDINIYKFYKILRNHIKENNDDKYVKELLNLILDILLDNEGELLEKERIVENFPYKIKTDKLKEDFKQRILYDRVMSFILDNIRDNIGQYNKNKKISLDNKIDNILKYWLPEFEVITFSEILILCFLPYGENRAKDIINSKRNFGHISRAKTYSGDVSKEEMNEEREKAENITINNVKKMFNLNKDELKNLLKKFNNIIESDELEEGELGRAKRYRMLLEKLLN